MVSSKGFLRSSSTCDSARQIESTVDHGFIHSHKDKKIDEQESVSVQRNDLSRRQSAVDRKGPKRSFAAATQRRGNIRGPGARASCRRSTTCRTLRLEVGKAFELTVSDSGNVYKVPVRVVEKKRVKECARSPRSSATRSGNLCALTACLPKRVASQSGSPTISGTFRSALRSKRTTARLMSHCENLLRIKRLHHPSQHAESN